MDIGVIVAVLLLFIVVALLAYVLYLKKQIPLRVSEEFEEKKEELRREALDRSRATLKGKVAEQIVPFLEDFQYHPADARFIGAPIDYIIFDGYSEDRPITVVLADIKTGKRAELTPGQRKIKIALDEKRVKWETIHLKTEE